MAAMRTLAAVILAAVILAACNPQPAPPQQASAAPTTPAPEAAPAQPSIDCRHMGELFDMLVANKAKGWTEADALADMQQRGEFAFGGPLVDSVFGDRFGPGGTMSARVDMLAACQRMAKGESLY